MGSKEEYYQKRLERHRDRAEYHAGMADKGIHTDHHKQKEAYHRQEIAKIEGKTAPTKKDTGPIGGLGPAGIGTF